MNALDSESVELGVVGQEEIYLGGCGAGKLDCVCGRDFSRWIGADPGVVSRGAKVEGDDGRALAQRLFIGIADVGAPFAFRFNHQLGDGKSGRDQFITALNHSFARGEGGRPAAAR